MARAGERGFTLIELVFGVTVMAVMVAAVGTLFMDNLATVASSKAKAIALALANEKMEHLRDLPYDAVATQNGAIYPGGNIPDEETVTRGRYTFIVQTKITYVDDPYDGYASCPCASGPASGKPKDLYPYDYKKAHIGIELKTSGQQVAALATDIAGKAAETASNTGILSITVIDASGQPIPNAQVHIFNANPNPDVDITTTTDNQGLVVIPKLPPYSNNSYQVTASLSGYSTDHTIPDPAGSQTAVKLNPNVLAQQITALTLAIDRVSTLHVHVADTDNLPKASYSVTITSTKKTKNNPVEYKYSQASTTDASGDITLTGMEWDSYTFSLPAGQRIVTSSPLMPASLLPNSSTTVNLVVTGDATWPTISAVTPVTGQTGTASSTLQLTGTNLASGTSVKLKLSGQSDITGTGCVATPGDTVYTCTVDLTGAASGLWGIEVVHNGKTAYQPGVYNVSP